MQTGLIVEPGNVDLLANQIHFALENRETVREMGANAAEFIQKHFSVGRVRTLTEEVYLDLV
jgi:glycosyltransferase involved in cell wall biosynthesis